MRAVRPTSLEERLGRRAIHARASSEIAGSDGRACYRRWRKCRRTKRRSARCIRRIGCQRTLVTPSWAPATVAAGAGLRGVAEAGMVRAAVPNAVSRAAVIIDVRKEPLHWFGHRSWWRLPLHPRPRWQLEGHTRRRAWRSTEVDEPAMFYSSRAFDHVSVSVRIRCGRQSANASTPAFDSLRGKSAGGRGRPDEAGIKSFACRYRRLPAPAAGLASTPAPSRWGELETSVEVSDPSRAPTPVASLADWQMRNGFAFGKRKRFSLSRVQIVSLARPP
jgi:hypothetical protein